MTFAAYALLAAATSSAPALHGEVLLAQLTIRQRVVVRVPVTPTAATATPPTVQWREVKGPKCIAIANLAGAAVRGAELVDLYMRGGNRVRAHLDDCDQIDLRYGFYLRPTSDGQVCGGRDRVHARTGGQCKIERFRGLVPKR
ncbi:MAG: hypothetical protein ACKVOP_01235 [Sphingomonadaceae bacterium]